MLQHGLAHAMPEAKTWYCSDDKASSTYENSDGFAMTISEDMQRSWPFRLSHAESACSV